MSAADGRTNGVSAADAREELRLLEAQVADLRDQLREVAGDQRDADDSGAATRMTEELEAQIAMLEARRDDLRRRLDERWRQR